MRQAVRVSMKSTFYGSTTAVVRENTAAKVETLKKLVAGGRAQLLVVSDFDHTLTKFTSPQCHDIVGFNKEYSTDFIREFKAIFYKPMNSLSEWWRVAHDLLVEKSGLTREMLQERLDEKIVAVRDGLEEFAINLRLNHVPLVVVSAGITDVISHTFQQNNLPVVGDKLFHIDANFMEFHESGKLTNILPEDPVHSESKSMVNIRASHMFELIDELAVKRGLSSRSDDPGLFVVEEDDKVGNTFDSISNVVLSSSDDSTSHEEVIAIVLGDRPHDFHVLEAYPWVHTLRIGFARHQHSEDVESLLKQGECDAVLVGAEHSLEPVHLLMDELIKARNGAVVASSTEPDLETAMKFTLAADALSSIAQAQDENKKSMQT